MTELKLIDIKRNILSDNKNQAQKIRNNLEDKRVYLVNLMASPGAGKTSVIIQTIKKLRERIRIGVIEGDIESFVDAEKIMAQGIPTVQIRTGGACHLDAPMIVPALHGLDLPHLDLVFIENIGNLVCPAEFDTGQDLKVMILSIPEGDDKVLKYPLMFSVCDVLLVNKIDYLDCSEFNMEALLTRVHQLNPKIKIFAISCQTGEGIDLWSNWLAIRVKEKIG